jgi:hypothetical protein
MDWLIFIVQLIILAGLGASALLIKNYLPSYTKEKGKNLATREDIEEITDKIESVKTEYAKELEGLKSQLNAKFHAQTVRFEKEFKVFEEVWAALVSLRDATTRLRPTIDYADPKKPEVAKERLEDFGKGYDGFYSVVHCNRPFFPQEIFDLLRGLLKLALGEARDYQEGWSDPRSHDPDYWKTAEKNSQEILARIEEICEAIRKRIKEYDLAVISQDNPE